MAALKFQVSTKVCEWPAETPVRLVREVLPRLWLVEFPNGTQKQLGAYALRFAD